MHSLAIHGLFWPLPPRHEKVVTLLNTTPLWEAMLLQQSADAMATTLSLRPFFSRISGPPQKFTPKIHAQVSQHSSPISLCFRREKEPKPKLFGPDIFGWGGRLAREQVGAKKLGMSFERQGTKLLGGILLGYPISRMARNI